MEGTEVFVGNGAFTVAEALDDRANRLSERLGNARLSSGSMITAVPFLPAQFIDITESWHPWINVVDEPTTPLSS
jgi:hypothetical protein